MKCKGSTCDEEATCRVAYPTYGDTIPISDLETSLICKAHAMEAVLNLGRGVTVIIRDLRESNNG